MKYEIAIDDWSDREIRDKLMEDYGNSESLFYGKNQNDEDISISVFRDKVVLVTYQNNGWVRKNYYYYGEDLCEEIFDGRWI